MASSIKPKTSGHAVSLHALSQTTFIVIYEIGTQFDPLGLKKKGCLFALFQPTQIIGKQGSVFFFFLDTQPCIFQQKCQNKMSE